MAEATLTSNEPKIPLPTPKRGTGRYKALLIILMVFLIGGLIGGFWWMSHAGIQETDNASLEGYLHPVSARVTGTVKQVLVEDNQLVKPGQVLAILDTTDYELAVSEAEHQLELAKAQVKTAQKNITVSERQANSQITQAQGAVGVSQSTVKESQQASLEAKAAVETARQNVAQQEANYQRTLADYQRYTALDPDAVSAQQLDLAKTNLRVSETGKAAAQAGLAQAQARFQQMRSTVGGSMAKVTQARGTYQGAQAQALQVDVARSQAEQALTQVKIAEDQLKQAKLNLGYTHIKAPAAGRIGRKTVQAGQRVQPGEPLMAVVPSTVWVIANFKETQLQKMNLGQPVQIEIDAFPDHPFTGRVDSFSPASGAKFALLPPENATGNFTKIVQRIPVKIQLDPKSMQGYQDRLVPGMSVMVKVNTNQTPRRTAS